MTYPELAAFVKEKLDKLTGNVETLSAKVQGADSDIDHAAAVRDLDAKLTQTEADLTTAKQTISSLTAEIETLKEANSTLGQTNTQLTADLAAAKDTIDKPDGEISKRAAIMANEIARKQGVPMLKEEEPKAGGKADESNSAYDVWAKQFPRK